MIPVVLPSLDFRPRYINPPDLNTWVAHLPFAYDLIRSLKPTLVVELGTYYGESFFGFCQSVADAGVSCMCYAVDTWRGDRHAGLYGDDVYEAVASYHQQNYAAFSYLLRTTFDSALSNFEDETISLLHIDGLHTYEAVSHDFYSWYPKVRPGGVILLHDIAMRQDDFGVWRFWDDLRPKLPNFAFHHGYGLGVIRKPGAPAGDDLVSELLCAEPGLQNTARQYYSMCGSRLYAEAQSRPKHTLLRLYWPDSDGYSEERSAYAHVRLNVWDRLCIRVPTAIPAGRLRIDPADSPGVIEISELVISSPASPEPLWSLDVSSMSNVQSGGTALRIATEHSLTIISDGNDPQLLLPEISAAPEGLVVQVRMRAHTGSQVISGFVKSLTAAYAKRATSETALRIVQTAVADPQGAVCQLEELVSLVDQLQQQLTVGGSQLEEAKSQTAHYQNLLEEQRQRAADFDNRFQEAASRAAHYQNLLEEQRQRAADFDNRFQEAASQAAHYQNLLEEQRQRAADFDNRFQEAASRAAHYQNLLQEQQQQTADCDARVQEMKSLAAHESGLLEKLRELLAGNEDERVSERTRFEDLLTQNIETASQLEVKILSRNELLADLKHRLAKEQLERGQAEEAVRSLHAKLGRFPARLFVR